MTSPEGDNRKQNEAVVAGIMALITAGRADDMLPMLTDDFVFELPYGPEGMPPSFDKATFAQMQSGTFKMFSGFKLEPTEFNRMLDPDALVAEYRSEATVAKNGAPYRNRYIGVFRFRDGLVAAWREFHNPDATKVLF